MTEEEINKYRLTSLEEPSDEMLSYIMKEIAEEVKVENANAHARLMAELRAAARRNKEKYNQN